MRHMHVGCSNFLFVLVDVMSKNSQNGHANKIRSAAKLGPVHMRILHLCLSWQQHNGRRVVHVGVQNSLRVMLLLCASEPSIFRGRPPGMLCQPSSMCRGRAKAKLWASSKESEALVTRFTPSWYIKPISHSDLSWRGASQIKFKGNSQVN